MSAPTCAPAPTAAASARRSTAASATSARSRRCPRRPRRGSLHGLLGGYGAGRRRAGRRARRWRGEIGRRLGPFKGAATVAVVAAIGVTAADRGGLIHVGAVRGGGAAADPERSDRAGRTASRAGRPERRDSPRRRRRPDQRRDRRRPRCVSARRRPPGLGGGELAARRDRALKSTPAPAHEGSPPCPPAWPRPRKAAPERLGARAADGGRPQSRQPRIRRGRKEPTPRTRPSRSHPVHPVEPRLGEGRPRSPPERRREHRRRTEPPTGAQASEEAPAAHESGKKP